MNGADIQRYIDADECLRDRVLGVFTRDQVPERIPEGRCLVANTLASTDQAAVGHWVALCQIDGRRELFDSLARKRQAFRFDKRNHTAVQHANSSRCGEHVLIFRSLRYRGFTLDTIVHKFYSSDLRENDSFANDVVWQRLK